MKTLTKVLFLTIVISAIPIDEDLFINGTMFLIILDYAISISDWYDSKNEEQDYTNEQ